MIGSSPFAFSASKSKSLREIGRETTTVRRPSVTLVARTVTVRGRTVPAAWSPSLCSEMAPVPSTTSVQGSSPMTEALIPTPNHTELGPVAVTSRWVAFASSQTPTGCAGRLPLTAPNILVAPCWAPPHSAVCDVAVLKNAVAVFGRSVDCLGSEDTVTEHPAGMDGSLPVVTLMWPRGPPKPQTPTCETAAAWHCDAVVTRASVAHAPADLALVDASTALTILSVHGHSSRPL